MIAGSFYNLSTVKAEGTKTISPTSAACTALEVYSSINSGSYTGCPEDNRIYVRIKDYTKENFYCGFHWVNSGPTSAPVVTDVKMKIYDPNGTLISTTSLPSSTGNGFIGSYASAVAGPNIGGTNPSGYSPLSYTPTMNGDYYITFESASLGTGRFVSPWFDFTVATSTGTVYNGRVHSSKWGFLALNPTSFLNEVTASAAPVVYPFSDDGVVYKMEFSSGFEPISFDLAFNSYGVDPNQTDWTIGRRSVNSATTPTLTNGYEIFLNEPDPTLYTYASLPPTPTFASPAIIGCYPGPYTLRFNVSQSGDCVVLLDLNGTDGYQPGTSDRMIELPNCTAGLNTYTWDGKDGLGNVVASGSTLAVSLVYRKGRANFPIYDAELNINGFKVTAIAPTNEVLRLYWDDSYLTNVGTSRTDGTNNITGAGIANILNGQLSPAHAWSGNGNPTMAIPAPSVNYSGANNETDGYPATDFGNVRTINTWFYGINLTAYSSTSVQCVPISGKVWDDANNSANGTFTNISSTGESGANAAIYVSLIDPVTNTVLTTTQVSSDGTYSFSGCPVNGNNMSIVLSKTAGVVGSAPPAASLPNGWVFTSPGTHLVSTSTVAVSGIDFGIQQIPIANSDNKNVNEDNVATGNVLTNDVDPENSGLSVTNFTINGTPYMPGTTVTLNNVGKIIVNADGSYTFTPVPDYNGSVPVISYTIKDAGGATSTSTLTIVVNAVNDPPRAINDVNTTYVGTPVSGNVLTNDSDPEGNTLTVTTQTNTPTSNGGTVTVNADGTYIYTPPAGFTGEDTFTYQVCDNGTPSACSTATVTIDVMPQPTSGNDAPVAVNDNYQGTINKPVSGNILSNDFDPDGTTLTVSSAMADTDGDGAADDALTLGTLATVYGKNASGTTVQAGTLTISNTGAMSFTPNADFTGTVPFTYNASDGSLTDNADGTITIEANPSNTNTTFATDDAYNVKSGHTLSGVSVLTNDNDPQGNTQTVQSVLADTDGDGLFDDAVSLGSTTQVYGKDNSGNIVIIGTLKVAATGEVTLVPTPNFAGTTQFVYTVSDNGTPQATDKATAYISVGKNTNYWIGTTSTNWNTTTNWTDNEVPFTGQNIEFATAANNNGNAAVNDLHVPGSGATPTEIGNLTNLSTKSTVIPAGNALIVDGTVTGSSTPSDAGKIVIQAANGTPNGTIIIDCASNSTGGVTNAVYGTVQMYAKGFKDSETTWTDNFTGSPTYGQTFTTSYHWQQFGVPVESVQAEPSFYGSYIRAYDEKYNGDNTTYYNKWHVLNNSSMLDAFKGYEITQDVQTVYQLQGKLQFCDKTIHLTREAPGVGTKDPGELESNWRYGLGQNVFGNSFTSSIAIDKMVFPTNVEKTVYLYNTGRFTDWGNAAETPNDGTALTAGQYTAIPQNASPAVYDQGIPSMNGFLLKFTDAETVYSTTGADVTLSYSNGGVKPNTKPQTVKGANEIQPASNSLSSLSVQLQSKSTVDRLWLLSESGTSRSYENGWDGRKYFGTPTAFIYTESSEGTPLQVSTSENIDGTVISFYDNGDKDYTLVLTKKNLENYSNLQLIDLKEKTFTPLTNDTTIYSFTSQSKDILERRFVITNVSGAKISSDAFKNLSGYLKDNDKLEIMNFTSREGMMYLYDTSGRVLKTARIAVSENEIPVSLQPGVYIVRLEADGKRESIKIAVR